MDSKEMFKLGFFVKNTLFGKPAYRKIISELGFTKQTDPVYVLEEVENNAPDCFYEIMEIAEKTKHVSEISKKYLEE